MQKERKLYFPKGRKLRILQVSDIQEMYFVRNATFRMLEEVYDRVQPDIIVFTGDNVHGNHADEYRLDLFKTKRKEVVAAHIKKTIAHICTSPEKRKIPFCMIFGNHDDLNCLTKQEQADFYKEYEYFFGLNSDEPQLDCDTCNVPIYSSDGEKIAYNLWLLDSAGQDDGTGNTYCYVTPETMEWYKRKSDELKAQNGGEPVPSLMFQHVPVAECEELFIECSADDPDAIHWKSKDGKNYKLDPTKATGYADEEASCCTLDVKQLETVKEQGDVCALVFGHDHANSFIADVKGVKLVQSPGASFRCYGTRRSRGVRVFEIDENDPFNFDTYELNYFELFGKNIKTEIEYFMNADEYDVKRVALFGSLAVLGTVAGASALAVKAFKKRRK